MGSCNAQKKRASAVLHVIKLTQCFLAACCIKREAGKPGILRDFSEHGKLSEFCATLGKNCNKQGIFSSSFKYWCKTAVDWVNTKQDH